MQNLNFFCRKGDEAVESQNGHLISDAILTKITLRKLFQDFSYKTAEEQLQRLFGGLHN